MKFAKDVIKFVKSLPRTIAEEDEKGRQSLIDEATQFVKIFSSIIEKSK